MSLVLKNKAVFLHIPKTGGNWIREMLKELDLIDRQLGHKHADHARYLAAARSETGWRRRIQPSPKRPFTFCFVRNPLKWYESWFKYQSQPKWNWRDWGDAKDPDNWHACAMLNGLGGSDFNAFVERALDKRPGFVSEMFGWYDAPAVDFVGRQENLREDFLKAIKAMGLEVDEDRVREFGKVGVSPKPMERIEWRDDVRRRAALCEYAGLVRYGYQSTLEELGLGLEPTPSSPAT
ncbi:hypothetical protein Mal64_25930 [Pseudobythopirellula maris]|uniref:Sulfotransferase family protein n=1 Tax=Pseudobythopirellula maris TaxID=2527991 RepID=A0A5C5ZQM8_9BACT|nr:sulfotransferase family 2 domain-containing protein [Pseudobythopirellula maris]TWT89101.1 hypothetical protein Mal64_25930 [Pseudobythopirellula maris]